jgi:hypothetical protein
MKRVTASQVAGMTGSDMGLDLGTSTGTGHGGRGGGGSSGVVGKGIAEAAVPSLSSPPPPPSSSSSPCKELHEVELDAMQVHHYYM